jgi:hypothetical protein
MWLGHTTSWWGLALAIAALVIMIPANVVSNVLTPLLLNWFATWSSAALEKRIAKLEKQLAELEKDPAIDEVQEQILLGITNLRGMALSLSSAFLLTFYVGLGMIVNQATPAFRHLTFTVYAIIAVTTLGMLRLRYAHDFRYKHSPTLRKQLHKAIDDLKTLRRQEFHCRVRPILLAHFAKTVGYGDHRCALRSRELRESAKDHKRWGQNPTLQKTMGGVPQRLKPSEPSA